MLESSKDLLYILLGVSIFMVAAFFSWVLYQIGQSIKGFNDVIHKVKSIADSIHEGITELKDKGNHAASYIGLFIKGGMEILKHLQKRRARSGKSQSDKK